MTKISGDELRNRVIDHVEGWLDLIDEESFNMDMEEESLTFDRVEFNMTYGEVLGKVSEFLESLKSE